MMTPLSMTHCACGSLLTCMLLMTNGDKFVTDLICITYIEFGNLNVFKQNFNVKNRKTT